MIWKYLNYSNLKQKIVIFSVIFLYNFIKFINTKA